MTLSELGTLLKTLATASITLRLEGRRLAFHAPAGAVTPELRTALAAAKPQLIAWCRHGHLTVPPHSPHTAALQAELDKRPALSWEQEDQLWTLLHWHGNLTAVLHNLRLLDLAAARKAAA